jgi:hypothetical protein
MSCVPPVWTSGITTGVPILHPPIFSFSAAPGSSARARPSVGTAPWAGYLSDDGKQSDLVAYEGAVVRCAVTLAARRAAARRLIRLIGDLRS